MTPDPFCSACEYSEPVQEPAEMLRCRRYAPRPWVAQSGEEQKGPVIWPIVAPEDWCGEFLEREE